MPYRTLLKSRSGLYAGVVSVLVWGFCACSARASAMGSSGFAALAGDGVRIGAVCRSITYLNHQPQNDYRVDTRLNCFKGADIKFFDDGKLPPGISPHSTAIASILIGMDPNAGLAAEGNFIYEGICPDAGLDVYEFRFFLTNYVFTGKRPGSDVITMSLGSAFEDWWTRGIDRMAEHYGILIVAAVGNGKNDYNTPLYPAAGDNTMAVGVAAPESTDLDASGSSIGPTADGRCKPDIVARADSLIAAAGGENTYIPCGDYSSFAAPVVAAAAALLVQEAKDDPNLRFAILPTVGNAVLKAILMTAAEKQPGWHKGYAAADDDHAYPLDLSQGAGLLDSAESLKLLKDGMQKTGDVNTGGWDVEVIEPNFTSEKIYRFRTDTEKSATLTATVVWNRVYQSHYPFYQVDGTYSDLRLELWGIDSTSGRAALIDYSDSPVDNVEHLYTKLDGKYSEYKLVVANSPMSRLPKTATPFAIAWRLKYP